MSWLPVVLLVWVGGCAHYEYDLVRPEAHRGHIGTKEDLVVSLDPLTYRLRAVENHLVVRVYNGTGDPVELLGSQSSAVDPSGQSHPLPPQTIQPDSFIKLILPPIPPTIRRTGPSIGFGVVAGRGYWGRPGYGYPDDYYDEPRYYSVDEGGSAMYWNWEGQTEARLVLVYRRNGKQFHDEFVFRRVKM